MTSSDPTELIHMIPYLDRAQVDEVIALALARRKELSKLAGAAQFAALKVGDKVRIIPTAKPKQLAGRTGVVTEKKITKVMIDLDRPVGQYHRNVVCPPDLLDFEDTP